MEGISAPGRESLRDCSMEGISAPRRESLRDCSMEGISAPGRESLLCREKKKRGKEGSGEQGSRRVTGTEEEEVDNYHHN